MRATVAAKGLTTCIGRVHQTLARKDPKDVLTNFLIKVSKDKILIASTNSILATQEDFSAADCEEGSILLNGERLVMLAKSLPEGDVTLQTSANNRVSITADSFSVTLGYLSADNFPPMHAFPQKHDSVDRLQFKEALDKVSFAICKQENFENFLAVKMTPDYLAAADGKLFALCKFPSKVREVLIPGVAVNRLSQILRASKEGTVSIGMSSSYLMFRVGNCIFMSRLSTAKFPDSSKMMASAPGEMLLSTWREPMLAAVKRVACTSPNKSQGVSLTLCGDDCSISSINERGDSSKEVISCTFGIMREDEFSTAEQCEILLNHKHLVDSLSVLQDAMVTFRFDRAARQPIRVEESGMTIFITRLSHAAMQAVDHAV